MFKCTKYQNGRIFLCEIVFKKYSLYFKLTCINQQSWTVIDQGMVDTAFGTPGWKGLLEQRTDGRFKHRYVSPGDDVYRFEDSYLS